MFLFPNKPCRFYRLEFLKKIDLNNRIAQPKWNGHRCLPVFDGEKLIIYSRHGTPLSRAAGNKWKHLKDFQIPTPWQLDGELTASGRLIIWDYAVMGRDATITMDYGERLAVLQGLENLPKGVELIETYPGTEYQKILDRKGEPELEGFVLKRIDACDLWGRYSTFENADQLKYRF